MKIEDIRTNYKTMTENELFDEIKIRTDQMWYIKMSENYDSLLISRLQNEAYEIERLKGEIYG